MKKNVVLASSFMAIIQMVTNAYGVSGRAVKMFSPNHVQEECIAIDYIPGGVYTDDDKKKEEKLCSIDFYAPKIAICPKEKSTSPGTYVYSLENTNLTQEKAEENCSLTDKKADKLASYKQTMNQDGTSGTYSMASLLYYHLSRYLQTNFYVPVSVYRTMDKEAHYDLIARKAQGKGMNAAGWLWYRKAELEPASYSERKLLYTDDHFTHIFGVLLRAKGERYGSYFYGTRERGWFGQYNDLKNAPPDVALTQNNNLEVSIQVGINSIKDSKKISQEIGYTPKNQEMVSWMQDMSEIEVMDYALSQQDRIGNIDYVWTWAYVEKGVFKFVNLKDDSKYFSRVEMANVKLSPPNEIRQFNPILMQRTILGDNDAGGLARYDNPTKRFHLLEELRHLNAGFYERFQMLASDFRKKGPLYIYFNETFGMQKKDLNAFYKNVLSASEILTNNCQNGLLRFDLDLNEYMITGKTVPKTVACKVN